MDVLFSRMNVWVRGYHLNCVKDYDNKSIIAQFNRV